MYRYNIAEKFVSINGEGRKAGQPAVFIRFKGCNLNCSYCDTLWANSDNCPAEMMTANDILVYIQKTGISNVTLTGGEPLIQTGIYELIDLLWFQGHISFQTDENNAVLYSGLQAAVKRYGTVYGNEKLRFSYKKRYNKIRMRQ